MDPAAGGEAEEQGMVADRGETLANGGHQPPTGRNSNTILPSDHSSSGSVLPPQNGESTEEKKVDPVEPEASRTKLQTFVIMASLCASVFLAALDVTIVTTALPTISQVFNTGAAYDWVGSAYLRKKPS